MELLQFDSVVEKLEHKRRQLGLNQNKVADEAGIDKGTLSRIEREKVDGVNYNTIYSVWSVLQEEEQKQTSAERAKDIMSEEIAWITTDKSARNARDLMTDHCFSQLPVKSPEQEGCVGVVTEHNLMKTDNLSVKVNEVMDSPLIEIKPRTSKESIVNLFKDNEPAVLVRSAKSESYDGIVTPADTF
jgi:predicted transcriptional regulator